MKIKVLQNHIDSGRRLKLGQCPLTPAVSRKFPGSEVIVNYVAVIVDGRVFSLPKKAKRFLADFDARRPVHPFEFELKEAE